jgi:hypothetical protein
MMKTGQLSRPRVFPIKQQLSPGVPDYRAHGKLAIPLVIFSLQACGGYPEQGKETVGVAKDDLYGLPSAGNTYWNGSPVGSPSGVGAVVPVCWTLSATQGKVDPFATTDAVSKPDPFRGQLVSNRDPTKTYVTFRQIKAWVQDAVENSWGRVSGLSFTGWDTSCATNGSADDKPLNPGKIMFALDSGIDYTDTDSVGRSTTHGSKVYFTTLRLRIKCAMRGPICARTSWEGHLTAEALECGTAAIQSPRLRTSCFI